MAVINLYTQAQVETALQRATVAMLLISQNIATRFLYFSPSRYMLYKNLQYDIYNLYSAVTSELQYMSFTTVPNSYEQSYYALVGAMIEKTKSVDTYGAYNGTTNPYYQPPSDSIVVISGDFPPLVTLAFSDFDPASEQIINGITVRTVYYNAGWKGFNPFMVLAAPINTSLFNNTDYTILSAGGFTLLLSGNLPGIADGQNIVVNGYANL